MHNEPIFIETLDFLTLSDSDQVDYLVCAEDRVNFNFLFEVGNIKSNFWAVEAPLT